ncbi:hypothetical protein ACI2JA_15225 [Alkalihalobacillus sp. NPDC078783]
MKRLRYCCLFIWLFLLIGCSLPDLGQTKPESKHMQLKHEPSYIEPVEVEEQSEEPVYTNQS